MLFTFEAIISSQSIAGKSLLNSLKENCEKSRFFYCCLDRFVSIRFRNTNLRKMIRGIVNNVNNN